MNRRSRFGSLLGAVALVAAAGCESPVERGAEAPLETVSQAVISAPDFVVSAVSGPASIMSGQDLITTVTVCNQGTQSGSAPVEVYLSADSTITPGPGSPDRYLGNFTVQYLTPGQCQTVTSSYWLSGVSEGSYYLGGVVDPQNHIAEVSETNNLKLGTRLGLGYKPDFTVSTVTGPASATPGQQLSAAVTVCNQGTQAGSVPLEVYLSADATITPHGPSGPSPDSFVGYAFSQNLNPGQCQTLTVQGPASVPSEGAYYLGAVVDPQQSMAELLETNNSRTGAKLGVGYRPDFVVTAVTGPASSSPGQPLTATVTVCNQGTQNGSAPVELYLSPDTTITPHGPMGPSPDYYLTSVNTDYLNPGQCQTLTAQSSAYGPADGIYYLGAYVDPQNGTTELVEDNNAKAGTRLGIGYKPDFTVSTVTGPASAVPGQQLSATVKVCNQGTQGGSAPVEVYLSADSTISPHGPMGPSPDSFVGHGFTDHLTPGQCQTLTVQGPANVPSDGAYSLGAYVDPQNNLVELIEDNNAKAGTRLGIGYKPDFIVSTVTGPASALPGQQFTATVKVCNQGTQGGSAWLEVYLSPDTTITPHGPMGPSPDSHVSNASTDYLSPGQCQTLSVPSSAYVPTDGIYYLGAYVDPQNNTLELLDDNNAKAGTRMGIGNRPDFVVSASTSASSGRMYQTLTATVTVCNQGTQGGSSFVEVYLSPDTTITPHGPMGPSPDFYLGYGSTDYLSPGQCQTLTVSGSAYVPAAGAYYVGSVVDPGNGQPELIDDNNTKVGTLVSITP